MQETQVRSLGGEDPLEKETATHSSILAWRISWTEEPGGLQPRVAKESDTTEQLNNDPERDGCSWDPVTGLKIQTLKFGQRKSREPTCTCATDEERLVSSSQAPFHPSSHDD